jgi:hypothetical protein
MLWGITNLAQQQGQHTLLVLVVIMFKVVVYLVVVALFILQLLTIYLGRGGQWELFLAPALPHSAVQLKEKNYANTSIR